MFACLLNFILFVFQGNISYWHDKYKTFNLSYSEQDIGNLLEAAKTNVRNNTEKIQQMLKAVANP